MGNDLRLCCPTRIFPFVDFFYYQVCGFSLKYEYCGYGFKLKAAYVYVNLNFSKLVKTDNQHIYCCA
jgi:hypothetical protein